ncbi:membrane protein insertion efficiency factor YidD [Yinghuangia seranimata]|uniref:membrane protein insertion efficiency factor YidD n=1 Tax=Yinghuangia seranimata TaxID=408067 RepID=UPI00248C2756|nr:membrane protein insertion efficiency factor YidD [Yinghuangia seranimata]MDI2126528.1 membrane protein insertion efficiency factor YidD [Yinghuangia seranimata]
MSYGGGGNPFANGPAGPGDPEEQARPPGAEHVDQGPANAAAGADLAQTVAEGADATGACDSCDGCDGCDCGSWLTVTTTLRLLGVALLSLMLPARGPRRGAAGRLLRAVHYYRREISPTKPPCCPYTPTCSTYAVTALERHGAVRGGFLTVRRLRRCRPGAGGVDVVPGKRARDGIGRRNG